MPPNSPSVHPLRLTRSPRLDDAVRAGWDAWERVARAEGAAATAIWLAGRAADPALHPAALGAIEALLTAAETDARLEAWADLAELADEIDPALADTLWDGALVAARAADDPDALMQATLKLAAIAEAQGDLLAAAEYLIDFLNWRRQPDHPSDPEDVETAFDEIVRLAIRDGAQREAAVYGHRQVGYTRLLEAEDDRAYAGDWERESAPYRSWA